SDRCQRRYLPLPTAPDAMVRIEHTNDARNPWFRSPPPRIACESDAARSSPVIGAVARHDLVASSIEAGNLDGILVGLGAAVGKEESVDIAGSDFGELGTKARAGFGSHERVRVTQSGGLLAGRISDSLIAVADVHAHQLAVEVDETLPFGCPEIDALGAGHGDGIDFGLGGPFKKSVLFGEIDDLLAGHGCIDGSRSHTLLISNPSSPQRNRDTEELENSSDDSPCH